MEAGMSATNTIGSRRELAHRSANGIDIQLLWNPATDSLVVDVRDIAGPSIRLPAAPDKALDVFNHPFAYARPPQVTEAPEEAPLWS